MRHRFYRIFVCTAVMASAALPGACSTTGSNSVTCSSAEVAPSSQPGSSGPRAALEWYLEKGKSGLPKSEFRLTGSSDTRSVYSDGTNQISVGALPAAEGDKPTWVVLMTYDCS